MVILWKVIKESVRQAWIQLKTNKLRSTLSLLGILIGIFCIISVKTAVDSLKYDITTSFEKLGTDVLFVTKLPWGEDPDENYWKYFQRENPDFDDFQVLQANLDGASEVAITVNIGAKTLKFKSNSVENAFLFAASYEYGDIFNIQLESGRYWTPFEYQNASNKIILGYTTAEELFGAVDPLGKTVKLGGHPVQVIGVIEKTGSSLVNPLDYDEAIFASYPLAKKIFSVKSQNPWAISLNIKAREGVEVEELKDEVIGVLRASRRLQPREDNDFSVNEIGIVTQFIDQFFGVVNLAGASIGLFAIFVGMFSVANIMFVSVKERTNIIGIKKAVGAKHYFILLEFLIEAVVLCIIGGIFGLFLVWLSMQILSAVIDFPLFLSTYNVILGIALSAIIGILSGVIPAYRASKLDPVVAMRQ